MKRPVVSVVQYGIGPLKSKRAFWQNVRRHIVKAKERQADLIVFPEYLTGHLLALAPAMTNAEACEYLHGFTGEYIETFTSLSRETGMIILGGTHIHRESEDITAAAASRRATLSAGTPANEPASGRLYYNEAFLFFPDGRIERQKKLHLTPEEQRAWPLAPGDRYAVFDTEFGRVAIQICYDIEFPEGSRIVADMGADIILCPSYTDAAAGYWRVRNCCQARAIENQLFVALSGIVGSMPHVAQIDAGYCQGGLFAPCDRPFPPDGILALGKTNVSGIASAAADLELLRENRTDGAVAPLFDRKPELYARYVKSASAARSK